MTRIRYVVAMSLDGYIAGPNGEADWIVMDKEVNFGELWAQSTPCSWAAEPTKLRLRD